MYREKTSWTRAGMLGFFLLACPVLLQAEPNWRDYAGILKRHTRPCTKSGVRLVCVNYNGIRRDDAWPRVVAAVSGANPTGLGSSRAQLAFYINAYNILAIQTVIGHPGIATINSVPNVWKRTAGVVAGRQTSLDGLEKGVIRAFGNPLYHFALVCAAVSCPDLRSEPYTGAALGRQLHAQTAAFLNNPGKGVKLLNGRTAEVTRLFDWYSGEFKRVGGTDAFVSRYVKAFVGYRSSGFLPYHWDLNGN